MSGSALYPSAAKLGSVRLDLRNTANDGTGNLTPAANTAMYLAWDAGAGVKGLPSHLEIDFVDSALGGTLNAGKVVVYISTKRAGATTPADTHHYREINTPQLTGTVNDAVAALGPLVVVLPPIEADQTILVSTSTAPPGTARIQVNVFGSLLT